MKNKLWLFQLPIVLICTFAYFVIDIGVDGQIENRFLREKVFTSLRRVSTVFTDVKFKIRGERPPSNPSGKVVIVEIDSDSLEKLGRWPWHRDLTARLIEKTFDAGAKVVGLDAVFSEPDVRVPPEMAEALAKSHMEDMIFKAETDPVLAMTIAKYKDRLVTGWTTEGHCQPLYSAAADCPVTDPNVTAYVPDGPVPKGFDKFASLDVKLPAEFKPERTPLDTVINFIANLDMYNQMAAHSGYFNADPDGDGIIRRTNLFYFTPNGKAYPSLALEMARVGLGDQVEAALYPSSRLARLRFEHSDRDLPVTPVGAVEINFRGKGRTFPYVSALELLDDGAAPAEGGAERKPASSSKKDLLKDAYVLIGISALGVFDMRAFPFDSNVAGVEGHATILDNLLANDFLTRGTGWYTPDWIYFLMIVGGVLFAFMTQKLEAIPAMLMVLAVFGGMGVFDLKVLFAHNVNWDLSFLFIEFFAIFLFTVAAKYIIEERSKKFVRGAFAKYVAPAVVDTIMKDPTKLTVGGEKRDLTIMFSDIRSFTTFSERMDAKALSTFLNDYLGMMTKLVFANEGTLDKYIGDAIMAFWGAPLDQPKHAYNACKSAIAMMSLLNENKARFKEQYGVDVEVGMGLNTGNVSVGNMGSNDNFAYTVIGDHVNLSSRLEGLTKYYGAGILCTRFTFDSIVASGEAVPPHRVLDFVKVKGKKNAVELIEVLFKPMNEEGLKKFEEARQLYLAQKWDEAVADFRKANDLITGDPGAKMDGPSAMYIERCAEMKGASPGPDWDGTWEMHSK